ncbi:hypothetical protein [Lactococcus petauri]|nr:hypothetical protein [Lactococcus petauri]
MKSLKDYERVEIKKKGKFLKIQIAVMLFFLLILISIFIIVRHQSPTHSSHEVVKSSTVHESIKKIVPTKKEKKIKNKPSASKKDTVPSQTTQANEEVSETSKTSTENNTSQSSPEVPDCPNKAPVKPPENEQAFRQKAIDEANKRAEEIAQSLASSAQEEGYTAI